MATHSSTLAWKIPWMEEPGRLQSMGLQRVGHNWATSLTHSLTHQMGYRWSDTHDIFLPPFKNETLSNRLGSEALLSSCLS